MNKKYLFFLFLLFFFPFGVNALSLKDGTIVDRYNIRHYFIENYYDSFYPYCMERYSSFTLTPDTGLIICIKNLSNISSISAFGGDLGLYSISFSGNYDYKKYSIDFNNLSFAYLGSGNSSGQPGYPYNKYFNFDFIYNGTTFLNNWGSVSSVVFYDITFNIPSGSNLVVKDSNNNIINGSNNVYSLESGTYTYSLTKSLYDSITDVSFNVSQDTSITLTLNPLMDLNNYNSIFSNYFLYLSSLVLSIFSLDNPLFLILFSFAIIFFVFLLIKKLLKGGF